jgi:hypothetical protein
MAASGYEFYAEASTHGFPDDPHFSINPAGYSYFSGKLGIGTTDPDASLQVGDGTDNNNFIVGRGAAGQYCGLKLARGDGDFSSTSHNNFGMLVTDYGLSVSKFTSAGADVLGRADYMVVQEGGNVGIGTATPSGELHVEGDIVISSGAVLKSVGSEARLPRL